MQRRALVLCLLLSTLGASADEGPSLSGAEPGDPGPSRVVGGEAVVDHDDPAAGGASWRLTKRSGARTTALVFSLPPEADASSWTGLSVQVRTDPGEDPVRLRLKAVDGAGRPLFQRRVDLEGPERWTRVEEPFALWRWEPGRRGLWSQVRGVALILERGSRVWLDDLRLEGPTAPDAAQLSPEALEALAFPDGCTVAAGEGVRVVHALPEPPPSADMLALLRRLAPIPRWLERLAGRPLLADPRPVSVLLHTDRAAYEAFFQRLGAAWRVGISPPRASGYTAEDLPSVLWEAEQGLDRPVILHEAVHAFVAHGLGLFAGNPRDDWLQEGLANYLQLCLYPRSLAEGTYRRQFSRPLDPDGGGFFKPLAQLAGNDVQGDRYAQVASVVAYLVEEQPSWLRALLEGVAAGQTPDEALAPLGASLADLEAGWFAWGVETYVEQQPPAGQHFTTPEEWR